MSGGPLGFDAGPERDRERGPRGQAQPPAPERGRGPIAGQPYGWFLGLAAVAAIVLIAVAGPGGGGPGPGGLRAGARLPPFAVPLVASRLSCARPRDPCDANVATGPGQKGAGSRPACEVRGPSILNVCELADHGPVVLALLATTGGDCADQLDPLRDLARRHPGVQVAVVGIRGDLGDLRALVARHRWSFPVGWDRDGVLASLYGVLVCPHVTIARWHGRVQSTTVGELDRRGLDRAVEAAVAASKRSGWTAPASG